MVNTTLFWMQTSLRKKALQVNRKALGVNKKVPWPCIHTSSDASRVGSNWVKICSSDLRQTLARTLSLPLCGIPMIILSTPNSLDLSMIVFIAGINTSQPSMPKRFSDDHFLARKASNLQYMKKRMGNKIQPSCKPTQQQQQHIYKNKQCQLYSIFHLVTMFT